MQNHDTRGASSAHTQKTPTYHPDYPDWESKPPAPPIDWDTIAEIIPPFVGFLSWLLWALFLLIPSLFGLHYAPMFSTANNTVFTLMGLVMCLAISTAIRAGHGARAIFFLLGISLLSFWF